MLDVINFLLLCSKTARSTEQTCRKHALFVDRLHFIEKLEFNVTADDKADNDKKGGYAQSGGRIAPMNGKKDDLLKKWSRYRNLVLHPNLE